MDLEYYFSSKSLKLCRVLLKKWGKNTFVTIFEIFTKYKYMFFEKFPSVLTEVNFWIFVHLFVCKMSSNPTEGGSFM